MEKLPEKRPDYLLLRRRAILRYALGFGKIATAGILVAYALIEGGGYIRLTFESGPVRKAIEFVVAVGDAAEGAAPLVSFLTPLALPASGSGALPGGAAPPSGLELAFPGAVGPAALALSSAFCARGPGITRVWRVTTTTDSIAGSLRYIITNNVRPDSLDIIIFDQGGLYNLAWGGDDRWIWPGNASCVYIAGQWTQGGGVAFQRPGGAGSQEWHIAPDTANHDIVIRYITINSQGTQQSLTVRYAQRHYLDHVTLRWWTGSQGGHTGLDISPDTLGTNPGFSFDDLTTAYIMMYEPADLAGAGSRRISQAPSGRPRIMPPCPESSLNIVHWRNYWAGPGHRTPNISACNVKLINSMAYNWDIRGFEVAPGAYNVDAINNYLRRGPATDSTGGVRPYSILVQSGCTAEGETSDSTCDGRFYFAGNLTSNNGFVEDIDSDAFWIGPNRSVACREDTPSGGTLDPAWDCVAAGDTAHRGQRKDTVITPSANPPAIATMTDALRLALADSIGNAFRLTCDGEFTPRRDAKDALQATHFKNGTGLVGTQRSDTVTSPVPAAGTACGDSDGDALPDAFETRYWGSATAAVFDADDDGDGYSNIEEYLNATDPTTAD